MSECRVVQTVYGSVARWECDTHGVAAPRDATRCKVGRQQDREADLIARAEEAEAALARVRELHGRLEVTGLSGPSFVCLECYDAEWPCATIRALDGETPNKGDQ